MTSAGTAYRQPILAAGLAALAVAGIGAPATDLGPWYQSLQKPSWQPPDWLFGPVRALIFGLAAVAGFSACSRARKPLLRRRVIALRRRVIAPFTLDAALNILRNVLFFRLPRPDWAPRSACYGSRSRCGSSAERAFAAATFQLGIPFGP